MTSRTPAALVALTIASALTPALAQERTGTFHGSVVAEWLDDGRMMRLAEPFAYTDPSRNRWSVPSGWEVDGASIPQALWLFGSPFVGQYRRASVIHDYYCDTKVWDWESTHKVFYNAMLTDGVPGWRAKLMYGAVYLGGPRWSFSARRFRRYGDGHRRDRAAQTQLMIVVEDTTPVTTDADTDAFLDWYESQSHEPSIEDVEAWVDARLGD